MAQTQAKHLMQPVQPVGQSLAGTVDWSTYSSLPERWSQGHWTLLLPEQTSQAYHVRDKACKAFSDLILEVLQCHIQHNLLFEAVTHPARVKAKKIIDPYMPVGELSNNFVLFKQL